jgi:DNA-binding Lrp family transcriptional regulator
MDTLDKKLLQLLLTNSRQSLTQLAKKTRASREVVTYRLRRLEQRGIILKYVTHIDIEKLGWRLLTVFCRVKASKEKEFRRRLREDDHLSWVSEHTGIWSYGLGITGRSDEEVQQRFEEWHRTNKDAIIAHRSTPIRRTTFMWEKMFGRASTARRRTSECRTDGKDLKILSLLSANARADYVELGKEAELTGPAIALRIRRMERAGIITQYSVFLDVAKLGKLQYSVFFKSRNPEDRERMLSHLRLHKDVVFLVEYLGDPFFEFGCVLDNAYALRPILQELGEAFPDIDILEYSLVQEDLVSAGPPRCVFE